MYQEFLLGGSGLADLDTEIRFNIANARAESAEIVRLSLAFGADERDNVRRENCLIKILRSMMRAGLIQFYVSDEDFKQGSTAAEFIINKYSRFISESPANYRYFYVKM